MISIRYILYRLAVQMLLGPLYAYFHEQDFFCFNLEKSLTLLFVDFRDSATAAHTYDGEEVCAGNYATEKSTGHYHCCHRLLCLLKYTFSQFINWLMMTMKTECYNFSQLQQKVVTSAIFKGKKDSYPPSIAVPFVDSRISQYSLFYLKKTLTVLHRSFCISYTFCSMYQMSRKSI